MAANPVVVTGSDCTYNPFAKVQPTPCGKLLDALSKKGIAYTLVPAPGRRGGAAVTIGGVAVDASDPASLDHGLGWPATSSRRARRPSPGAAGGARHHRHRPVLRG